METENRQPTRGFYWAIPMSVLILVECVALKEAIFGDLQRMGLDPWDSFAGIYTIVVFVTFFVHLAGMLLVLAGWYRLGGALQILGSSVHVLKGEGIVGVIGGWKAWRYGGPVDPAAGATRGQGAVSG